MHRPPPEPLLTIKPATITSHLSAYPGDLAVLEVIRSIKRASVEELVLATGKSKSTVWRSLLRMSKLGIVFSSGWGIYQERAFVGSAKGQEAQPEPKALPPIRQLSPKELMGGRAGVGRRKLLEAQGQGPEPEPELTEQNRLDPCDTTSHPHSPS